MLRRLDEGLGNTLGYEVKGKLTEKEFETLSEESRRSSPSMARSVCSSGCPRYLGWSSALWQRT
jgi:hypothetical protein